MLRPPQSGKPLNRRGAAKSFVDRLGEELQRLNVPGSKHTQVTPIVRLESNLRVFERAEPISDAWIQV